MPRLILVCGSTGAGKTTHTLALAEDLGAVRFSIDHWMVTLFAADMKELDYEWMMERVQRCHEQIWKVSSQVLKLDGNVILDLGFTMRSQRQDFVSKAKVLGVETELHYLDVPVDIRKKRVAQRNTSKEEDLYAFEVTDFMFNFMEKRFEVPDEAELENGLVVK